MADYGFIHEGRVFTPDCTIDIPPTENTDRNTAIERAELDRWKEKPDRMLAYYTFPAEETRSPKTYRAQFYPQLFSNAGSIGTNPDQAYVSTWPGTKIGVITSARVFSHNFGGRMVALTVHGTNGAYYYGRASWDNGSCVWLRRRK